MMKKIILISILCLTAIASFYNFLYPIRCTNSCDDNNIFRYRFGVYTNNPNLTNGHDSEYKRIGGILEFFKLTEIKCEKELLKEHYEKFQKEINLYHTSLKWRELNCGLWINKNNDIGFITRRAIGAVEEKFVFADYYLTKFGFNENPPLKSVIDTLTFRHIGNDYYKDNKNVYHHYAMSDGGSFYILNEADYETFEVLGDCYARDKNHIYEYRLGILDSVDNATFKTKEGLVDCLAKDKFGYISSGRRINDQAYLKEAYMQKAIRLLESE